MFVCLCAGAAAGSGAAGTVSGAGAGSVAADLPSIALLRVEQTGSLCRASSWYPTGLFQGSE